MADLESVPVRPVATGTCPVCAAAVPAGARCLRCGAPEVPEAAARGLAEAVDLLAAGALDAAIRRCRQASADAPESWFVRVRLAAAFERKAQSGETALYRLADRELAEAAKLAPGEREVHLARVTLGAKTGRLPFLRAEFTRNKSELVCAEECLRIIDSLEQVGGLGDVVDAATGSAALQARFMFAGAVGAGIAGVVQMSAIIHAAMQVEGYDLTAQGGFWLAVLLLTGAGALGLEGWRRLNAGRGR